jgi:peptide/nickel transport system ATP-binding protein
MMGTRRLLDVKDLKVTHAGKVELDGVSLTIDAGEALVILGEASSGNDALLRVLANATERGDETAGTIRYGDGEAKPAPRRGPPTIRIAYFCGARAAPLNPYASVISQLGRAIARKLNAPGASGCEELRIALERFPHAPPFARFAQKPAELSDVETTWALMAAAIAQTPDLLIADHAFSGLTPTAVEALAGALMDERKRLGFALIYGAESLQTAAHLRCRMMVLRRGKVIEEGDFEKLAAGQSHVYTQTLFRAMPRLIEPSHSRGSARGEPLLQVQSLDLSSRKRRRTRAQDGISFELRRGASLAFVGEEGSGRRALVRAMLGLDRFSNGRVVLDQVDMSILSAAMTSRLRRRIAFITGSDDALDPRMTLWDTVDEPLRAHLRLPRDMIAGHRETALKRVGLASHDGRRAVATLSPFDKRRLQVARAIVSAPFLAVIDEPLRGLDAFAQSIMIELLKDLRRQEGPAFLIITADMRVAQALGDDAMIFKNGKLVERGPLADIVRAPKDEETRKLLEAAAPSRRVLPEKLIEVEPQRPEETPSAELLETSVADPEETSEPVERPPDEQEPPLLLDQPIADDAESADLAPNRSSATESSG